jgi:hypothetical protein
MEEALPLDHQVQRIVGLLEIALGEDDRVGRRASTQAELQAAGNRGLRAGGRAGLEEALIQEVLELGAARLEPGGVGVGQVVGDIVDAHLLGVHAAARAIECSDHVYPPCLSY